MSKVVEQDPPSNIREYSDLADRQFPSGEPQQDVASGPSTHLIQDLSTDPDAWITVLNKEALVLESENRSLPIDGSKPVLRERLIKDMREMR